jgi:hypothetical protein
VVERIAPGDDAGTAERFVETVARSDGSAARVLHSLPDGPLVPTPPRVVEAFDGDEPLAQRVFDELGA